MHTSALRPTTLQAARLTIDPALIQAYAELTNDHNPIHLDADFAARTPMGGVIAHGTLSLGLIWQSLQRTMGPGVLSGAQLDIRFVKPVRVGERLVAGGQRCADDPNTYDVWVVAEAAGEGQERIVGRVTLKAVQSPFL